MTPPLLLYTSNLLTPLLQDVYRGLELYELLLFLSLLALVGVALTCRQQPLPAGG